MTLKFKRGTDTERQTVTPEEGEPIYATDTKKMFIGDGVTAGGVAVDTDTGQDNTNSDAGTSSDGEGLVNTKVGVDTPIKRIKGGTGITVSSETNDLVITNSGTSPAEFVKSTSINGSTSVTFTDQDDATTTFTPAGGGGSGESNTNSNATTPGTNEAGLVNTKSGVDTPIKVIKGGSNVTVVQNANDVTISASGGGSGESNTNSDATTPSTNEAGLVNTKVGVDTPIKVIKGGTNITVTENTNDVTISGPAEFVKSTSINGSTSVTFTDQDDATTTFTPAGGGGSSSVPDPSTSTGTNQIIQVNTAKDAYEFTDKPSGGGSGGGVTVVSTQAEVDAAASQGNIIFTTVSGLVGPDYGNQTFFATTSQRGPQIVSIDAGSRQVTLSAIGGEDFTLPIVGSPTFIRGNTYFFSSSSLSANIILDSAFQTTNETVVSGDIVLTLAAGPVINSTNFPPGGRLFNTESTVTLDSLSWYGNDGGTFRKFTVT